MIKKTIVFQSPVYLSIKNKQLQITVKKTGEITSRPVEDIGFIILDNQQITLSQSVMQGFAEQNTAVIICDKKHLPTTMMLHLDGHHTQNQHFRSQIEADIPLKKRLWKQTVRAKIKNQASVLECHGKNADALRYLISKVKSGDATNVEARAARYYWPKLFGGEFLRARFGLPPNNLLNYGYAVLRAATARALAGSGLLPTLGIHHHNKYNSFCLADDMMEPYRPYVDYCVKELTDSGMNSEELSADAKKVLLAVLTSDVVINKKKRPLMLALSETTASLSRCFKREEKKLSLPIL